MDPSLIEIIKQAILSAQGRGLDLAEQQVAAEEVLTAMIPSLSPSIAHLIVEQLLPFVGEMTVAA